MKRTCALSAADGFAKVISLRAQCQGAAPQFGNADACTQCTALAEPHVPNCGSSETSGVGPSKCSALGAETSTSGMPASWFDNYTRWHTSDACLDAYSLAFAWCTGTDGEMPQMRTPGDWDTQSNPTCSGEPSSFSYGTIRYLYATEIDESEGEFNNAAWVFPMSTVRKEWTTFTAASDPCDFGEATITNSFDSTLSAELYPATIGNWNDGYLAGPMYPRCGVLQRRWWSNENCVATESDVGFSPTNLGFFDPNTGEESYQSSVGGVDYCMLREPRRFHGTCSNGATCNAGGECVSGPEPEVRMISTPLP